ncbi:hypothetical protein CELL_03229 [Cellulomonas sp. T2.31MG-18]
MVTSTSTRRPRRVGLAADGGRSGAPGPLDRPPGPVARRMNTLVRALAGSWVSDPRVAVSLAGAGLLLGMLLGATAPNAEAIGVHLPLSLLPSLSGHTVLASLMLYAAEILAGLGLAGMIWANSKGWRPDPRHLLVASAVVVAVMVSLTPVGSSDVASYAVYGRIAAQGGNPYVTSPLAWGEAAYLDPVGMMWKDQPSVYGPVATLLQSFAAWVGGSHVATTVLVWMVLNGLVFLGVGVLLLRTSDDPVRATLFWTANPVLILALVGGGHLDTLVAAAAVGAIQVARKLRSGWGDVLAGVLVGLGSGVKISAVLIGLGLAWPLVARRQWGRLLRMSAAAAAVLVVPYTFYGASALGPLLHGLQLVTWPSPWRLVEITGRALGVSEAAMMHGISLLWPLALLVVAWLLNQRIATDQPREVVGPFVLVFAWILVAPWVFAWYTAVAWAALSQVPRNRMTRWLTLVTVVLALFLSSGGHPMPVR